MRGRAGSLLLLAAVIAAGCATEERYAHALQAWTGRPVSELVRVWRPPDAVVAGRGGTRLYRWDWHGVTENAGAFLPDGQRVQPRTTHRRCTSRATVGPDGLIRSWTWEGNGCLARPAGWEFLGLVGSESISASEIDSDPA